MMQFHHMALMVSDLEKAISFWRDVMGFDLKIQMQIPDGDQPGPTTFTHPELLDDIFKVKNARSLTALMTSSDGAFIELQQPLNPLIQKTPRENLRYAHTGIHELGLKVEDIFGWHKKIKDAGFEVQTDYVWKCANFGYSFLFYDHDGNMIQLWQDIEGVQFS